MKKHPIGEREKIDNDLESNKNTSSKKRKVSERNRDSLLNDQIDAEKDKLIDNVSISRDNTTLPLNFHGQRGIQPGFPFTNLSAQPPSLHIDQLSKSSLQNLPNQGVNELQDHIQGGESLLDNYLMNTISNPGNIGRDASLRQLTAATDNNMRMLSALQERRDHLLTGQHIDPSTTLSTRSALARQLLDNTSTLDRHNTNPFTLGGNIDNISQGNRNINIFQNDQARAIAQAAALIPPGINLNQSSSSRSISTQGTQQNLITPNTTFPNDEDRIRMMAGLVHERQRQLLDIQKLLATNRAPHLGKVETNLASRTLPVNEHAANASLLNLQDNLLAIDPTARRLQDERQNSLNNQFLSSDHASIGLTTFSKESATMPSTSAGRRETQQHPPVDLYMQCDNDVLSDYQILLRKQIEFFEAGPAEVKCVSQSRRKAIRIGQVGIRCKHCGKLPPMQQPKGTVYYPSYLRALYQAGQNMATSHFMISCESIDKDCKEQLKKYREGQALVGHGGKKYWEDCAKAVGITETLDGGLRFRPLLR